MDDAELAPANEFIAALQELRNLLVAMRRARVLDSVRHDLPSGSERRLIDVQSAILAIDEAIRDEQVLGLRAVQDAAVSAPASPGGNVNDNRSAEAPCGPAIAEFGDPNPLAAPHPPAWGSYADWRRSSRAGSR